MSEHPDYPLEAEQETPVIRDKRRIDPLTGEVRAPAATEPPAAPQPAATDAGGAAADQLLDQLAERTADLQRLQAEYTNYRRRVERDREAVREQAVAAVLVNLLPVLDDIGRARTHGELEGGFKAVAEALEATVDKLGLQAYGAEGDPFDPVVHEAITHGYSDEVTEPTAVTVFQVGYRIGNRIVRPARVGVAEPAEAGPVSTAGDGAQAQSDGEAQAQ